ncbi:MAG: VanZ family protein [Verrucomicrobiae bacterium]|nr:VanZ family protein [Verrucomicrobiae bacterium]
MKIRRVKIVLCAFVLFMVGLVAWADSGHGSQFFRLANRIPAGDKLGHFILFGMLSFLVNLVLRTAEIRLWRISILKGSAMVMFVATLEEVSQLFLRSRSFDLADLTAGLLGIWFFGWLAKRYCSRQRSKPGSLAGSRNSPV